MSDFAIYNCSSPWLPASACSSSFFLPLPPNNLLNKDWRLLVLLWLADADGVSASCVCCASPPSEEEDDDEEEELVVFFSAAAAVAASFSSATACSDEVAAGGGGGGDVPAASLMLWLLVVCFWADQSVSMTFIKDETSDLPWFWYTDCLDLWQSCSLLCQKRRHPWQ